MPQKSRWQRDSEENTRRMMEESDQYNHYEHPHYPPPANPWGPADPLGHVAGADLGDMGAVLPQGELMLRELTPQPRAMSRLRDDPAMTKVKLTR